MEGQRLIIKRRIPKGRQELVAIFVGAFLVVGLVGLGQLKATLSANALSAVKSEVGNTQNQLVDSTTAAKAQVSNSAPVISPSSPEAAVEKFKKLLQDTSVPAPTIPSGQ